MPVPDNNGREASRWLRTAERDLQAARWNRQGEFYNTACFQAQQAAEKALKAYLLSKGERNIRSHSALELLDRCKAFWPPFETFRADCRVLDRHYIPTRYPDALPEGAPVEAFGPEDADDAIARAERVLDAVRQAMQGATAWIQDTPRAGASGENEAGARSQPEDT